MSRRSVSALLSVIATAGFAFAQTQIPPDPQTGRVPGEPPVPGMPDTTPDEPASLPPPPPGPPEPEPQPESESDTSDESSRQDSRPMKRGANRVSQLIGQDVFTPAGETIGEVRDLVLGEGGTLTHAIVAYAPAGSEETRLVAVPWEILTGLASENGFVMDRIRLAHAPSFTASTLPDFSSPQWSRQADRYWTSTRAAAGEPALQKPARTEDPDRG